MILPFGKFGPNKGDPREIEDVPSDYLRYLMEEDDQNGWVSERHGSEVMEEIEDIMARRDNEGTHWHEYEEESDALF